MSTFALLFGFEQNFALNKRTVRLYYPSFFKVSKTLLSCLIVCRNTFIPYQNKKFLNLLENNERTKTTPFVTFPLNVSFESL